jgi:hypothetical protein
MDVSKPYNEVIPVPTLKKQAKEEVLIEEDSNFFEKYINVAQVTSTAPSNPSEKEIEKTENKNSEGVTDFFKRLLTEGPNRRDTTARAVE